MNPVRAGALAIIAFAAIVFGAPAARLRAATAQAHGTGTVSAGLRATAPETEPQTWVHQHPSLRHELRQLHRSDRRTPDPMPNHGVWVSWTCVELDLNPPSAPVGRPLTCTRFVSGGSRVSGRTTRGPPA